MCISCAVKKQTTESDLFKTVEVYDTVRKIVEVNDTNRIVHTIDAYENNVSTEKKETWDTSTLEFHDANGNTYKYTTSKGERYTKVDSLNRVIQEYKDSLSFYRRYIDDMNASNTTGSENVTYKNEKESKKPVNLYKHMLVIAFLCFVCYLILRIKKKH